MRRKAQFFMVGTLLVAGLIFGIVGLRGSAFITGDAESNTRRFFVQGIEEFPRAVDSSLKEEHSVTNLRKDLESYIRFLRYTSTQRGLSAEYYFLTGVRTDAGFDVVFGNYMGDNLSDVNITLGTDSKRFEDVEEGTLTESFSPGSESFDATVEFLGRSKSVKVYDRNFYVLQGIADGDRGKWRKEVVSR